MNGVLLKEGEEAQVFGQAHSPATARAADDVS